MNHLNLRALVAAGIRAVEAAPRVPTDRDSRFYTGGQDMAAHVEKTEGVKTFITKPIPTSKKATDHG